MMLQTHIVLLLEKNSLVPRLHPAFQCCTKKTGEPGRQSHLTYKFRMWSDVGETQELVVLSGIEKWTFGIRYFAQS